MCPLLLSGTAFVYIWRNSAKYHIHLICSKAIIRIPKNRMHTISYQFIIIQIDK